MRRKLAWVILLLSAGLGAAAQDRDTAEKTRSGWSVVPLPTVSFTADKGWQFGALAELYYYGPNRSRYPDYDHKFYFDFGIATKGGRYGFISYDSDKLIPGLRLSTSVMYQNHKSYPFMGFNGLASPYHETLYYTTGDDGKQQPSGYYQMHRNMIRFLFDLKGDILPHFRWAAGLQFWVFRLYDTKWPLAATSLLHRYVNAGILSEDEAKGGIHAELKAGVLYDTRDSEASTKRGIWAEAFLYGSPDIFEKRNSYFNAALHFRHYVPLVPERLTFAYHLAYQGTLWGEMPFYMLSNIASLQLRQVDADGLGSYTSLRGILYNRMLGKGYAWSNIELRWFIVDFKLLGIDWGIAVNPLIDMGMVVQPYRLEALRKYGDSVLYSDEGWAWSGDKLHVSYGLGAKLTVNTNFVLSAEYARPVLKQDGTGGLNVGVGYIF